MWNLFMIAVGAINIWIGAYDHPFNLAAGAYVMGATLLYEIRDRR